MAKTLDNVNLPVVVDQFTATDSTGGHWLLELYIDTPDGTVRARVVDPPPKSAAT